eukprot:jgi/Botrbrau1/17854/Bobra.0127s0094.1
MPYCTLTGKQHVDQYWSTCRAGLTFTIELIYLKWDASVGCIPYHASVGCITYVLPGLIWYQTPVLVLRLWGHCQRYIAIWIRRYIAMRGYVGNDSSTCSETRAMFVSILKPLAGPTC